MNMKKESKIEKRLNKAMVVATTSDFRVKVGCVVYNKGKLIATGASTNKTHPLQHKFNSYREYDNSNGACLDKAHAEMVALSKIKNMDIDMRNVTFYIARLCKSQAFGLARPCKACMRALREAGVRRICYTTEYNYVQEMINYKERGYAR